MLRLAFAAPVDLGAVIIRAGVPKEQFVEFRRPATLELVSGENRQVIELEDVPTAQELYFDLRGVTELEVRVTQARGPAGAAIAISEMELFAKR